MRSNAARLLRPVLFALSSLAAIAPLGALESTEVVRRTFTLAGAGRALSIDNVFGSVTVRSGTGDRVELVLHQTWRADDATELERAKREVTLGVVETPGRLELVQDGPFRDDHGRRGRQRNEKQDYEVSWEWQLTVPRDVDLEVGNVNGGGVEVTGVRGPVAASNVNGDVRVADAGARASASTVNGDVDVDFSAPLAGPAEFETVNGDVRLAFPAGFGAELEFSTLHGEVYTDFPFESTAMPTRVERSSGERGVRFELGRESLVRLGVGGPRLTCNTVNGDILIRER